MWGSSPPPSVDDVTGFRYYAPDQIPSARLVGRLRSVDVPLDEIRSCLEGKCAPEVLERVLIAHRTRLESRATRIAGNLHELSHLLDARLIGAHLIGKGLEGIMTNDEPAADLLSEENERKLAARCFNSVWDLMEKEDRTGDEDDLMVHMAHASRYHWGQAGKAENVARGEWQVSRVYAVLRRPEPCLYHAERVLDVCTANGIDDWDIAFAYEALARAHAISGDAEAARTMTERALEAAEKIKKEEDRKIVMADLETIPGQKRFW